MLVGWAFFNPNWRVGFFFFHQNLRIFFCPQIGGVFTKVEGFFTKIGGFCKKFEGFFYKSQGVFHPKVEVSLHRNLVGVFFFTKILTFTKTGGFFLTKGEVSFYQKSKIFF